jgi:hypothetical protein
MVVQQGHQPHRMTGWNRWQEPGLCSHPGLALELSEQEREALFRVSPAEHNKK